MDFLTLMKTRYSVRKFDETKPVSDELIQQILEAGRIAPTAKNCQPQRVYVIKSPEALATLRSTTRMCYNAPLAFLVGYDKTVSCKASMFGDDDFDIGMTDADIVATSMMMEATDLGLGTLWARGFAAQDFNRAFALPDTFVPMVLLDVGYAAPDCVPSPNHEKRFPMEHSVIEL